ncbi:MAG TPA: ROK family protein [Acidobacteriota bacterium]|jgi:glucokinase|nr:ROK family protein [Acidobacteriota bacterium]
MKDIKLIAVDLGGTNLRIGRIQQNIVTERHARPVPVTDNEQIVLNELIDAIEKLIDKEISGIGIGVPSVVDVDRGIVYTVQNIPSWKEVHLKEVLERKFHVPVHVNNDANCFALGEFHFGKGRGYKNLVGIAIGTGLGAGIIIDGRLYSGTNCGAGEIGTIPYKDRTVENYCSGEFFTTFFGMSGETMFERAKSGDAKAIQAFEEFGKEMAHAVLIALYSYDPQIIILGGSISRAFELFKKPMMEKLYSTFAFQHALKRLVLDRSELTDVALLGAAALHLDAMEKQLA